MPVIPQAQVSSGVTSLEEPGKKDESSVGEEFRIRNCNDEEENPSVLQWHDYESFADISPSVSASEDPLVLPVRTFPMDISTKASALGATERISQQTSFDTPSSNEDEAWRDEQTWRSTSSRPKSIESYITASSGKSFYSTRSTFLSSIEEKAYGLRKKLKLDYHNALAESKIVRHPLLELNWSGKGQHVIFEANDSVPLRQLNVLGHTNTALVEKVLCRRVALARKTVQCSRDWNVRDMMREVEHLHKLRHSHVVQLVGTYLQEGHFSILMYPAAECHLGAFLEETAERFKDCKLTTEDMNISYRLNKFESSGSLYDLVERTSFLGRSLKCLAHTLAYIHQTTKHLDIKPGNILVSNRRHAYYDWHIYLADFGLSKGFVSSESTQTDGPLARTPRYCAPEVYDQDLRGRAADIFSMGCVFAEIMTVNAGYHIHEFSDFRRGVITVNALNQPNGNVHYDHKEADRSDHYHENIDRVSEWIDFLEAGASSNAWTQALFPAQKWLSDVIKTMIHHSQELRPKASDIVEQFRYHWGLTDFFSCCDQGPEAYVTYQS